MSLDPAQLAIKESEAFATTVHRRDLLRRKTIASFLWILSGVVLGVCLPVLLWKTTAVPSGYSLLAIVSVVCFSWATLGRLGWAGQSYKGQTVFEELDTGIFWVLYWFGTLLGTAALAGPTP